MHRTLIAAAFVSLGLGAQADELAGYDKLSFKAQHRTDTVAASVWYPVGTKTYQGLIGDNPVFVGIRAMVGAAPASGKHPLVVVSHGSGGNMDNFAWLSSELAKSGAIVLGLNHPGSTSGDSSPRRSIHVEERAADLRSALDMLLADPTFGPLVDKSRISALGFSLGGTTILETAGARFDRKAYKSYCDAYGKRAMDCVFFGKGGVDIAHLPEELETDGHDARFGSFIAIDPGFTQAFTGESLGRIDRPTLLVNLADKAPPPAVDLSAEGSNLTGKIKGSEYAVMRPANHFTFLPLCKPDARQMLIAENEDPICDDPASTDRGAIHTAIIDRVKRFLHL